MIGRLHKVPSVNGSITHINYLGITILFKIITRIKLLFSNYLGDYSYSFQGSVELICITVTVSLFLLQNAATEKNPLGNIWRCLAITVT